MDELNSINDISSSRKRPRTRSPTQTMTVVADPSRRLPPETFLYILSFLSPPTLSRCAQVSRDWYEICTDEGVWRDLALRLGYCQLDRASEERQTGTRVIASVLQQYDRSEELDPNEDLLQATIQRYRSRNTTTYFDDCNSWQSLCCLLWRLNRKWSPSLLSDVTEVLQPCPQTSSKYPSSYFQEAQLSILKPPRSPPAELNSSPNGASKTYLFPHRRALHVKPDGSGVWRCKLDPEEKTFIVTGQNGGIQVFDHTTKTLLWHIPRTATRSCPHLEFSRGWFIFDRPGIGHFEVWRSERLVPDLGRAPDRGHYQRFTILSSTRPIRAYRFQFPYLCAASQDGFITIWNVPQQEEVETIDMRNSPHRDGNITYIDFDDEFVFLNGVGAKSVSVFSRRTQRMVWNMGQHFAAGAPPPATWRLEEMARYSDDGGAQFCNPAFVQRRLKRAPQGPWQSGPNTMNLAQLTMTPYQIWSAVHPDIKTKTLLILGQGTVLLIRDYKKYFNNPGEPPDLFVEIEFTHLPQWYHDVVLGGEEDWSELGWNSRRLWELRGDAQLTVHEGKAVLINELPLILDLNVDLTALHTDKDEVVDVTALMQDGRQGEVLARDTTLALPGASAPYPGQGAASGVVEENEEPGPHEASPPVIVYTASESPSEHIIYKRCSSLQMDEAGVYFTLDREGPYAFEADEIMPEDLSGEDRVLLQLDFTRRHELRYDPFQYPHLFDLRLPRPL